MGAPSTALGVRRSLLLPVLLSCASCGSSSSDYAVTPNWLINGVAPDAVLCAQNRIETVRFSVNGRSIEAPCTDQVVLSDGLSYGGFTTTSSFRFDDVYPYAIDMLDAKGRPVAGYKGSFRAMFGDITPVELLPLELFSPFGDQATLTGSFGLNGSDLAQACEKAGIDSVAISLASATDSTFQDAQSVLSAPCAAGKLASQGPLLARGDYQAKYLALDAQGQVVTQSAATPVTVDPSQTAVTLPFVRLSAP